MQINYPDAVAAAKSITELAIQHNFINAASSVEETAKEIATFYNTFVSEIYGED